MDPLVHRIRETYDALPLGERKLAELILEMRGDLAAYSATELAARSGVSKATAARLVRRLGYADFHEMRQQARNHCARQARSYYKIINELHRLELPLRRGVALESPWARRALDGQLPLRSCVKITARNSHREHRGHRANNADPPISS